MMSSAGSMTWSLSAPGPSAGHHMPSLYLMRSVPRLAWQQQQQVTGDCETLQCVPRLRTEAGLISAEERGPAQPPATLLPPGTNNVRGVVNE